MAEITSGNFEQRLSEWRTYAQALQNPYARDIMTGVLPLLQTAERVERDPSALRSTTTHSEQRTNR